jgi:hypothetical protein
MASKRDTPNFLLSHKTADGDLSMVAMCTTSVVRTVNGKTRSHNTLHTSGEAASHGLLTDKLTKATLDES